MYAVYEDSEGKEYIWSRGKKCYLTETDETCLSEYMNDVLKFRLKWSEVEEIIGKWFPNNELYEYEQAIIQEIFNRHHNTKDR